MPSPAPALAEIRPDRSSRQRLRGTRRSALVARRAATVLVAVLVAAVVAVLAVGFGSPSPAAAETPSEVADGAADDGVFVASSRTDVDEALLADAVADADRLGLDLIVVAPSDPQPSAAAFARRVQELTEVDVAMVFPEEGPVQAYVIEDLTASRPRALDAARSLVDPAQAIGAFSQELISDGTEGRPAVIGRILRWLLLCSLIVGAVVLIEFLLDQARRRPASVS